MIPVVAAYFARPLIKYGVIGAMIVVFVAGIAFFTNREINKIEQRGYDRRVAEDVQAQLVMDKFIEDVEADLAQKALKAIKEKDNEIFAINGRLSAALIELRKRPPRRSEPQLPKDTAACSGATGSDLSGPDSEFLAGEAARADRMRSDLNLCIQQYENIRSRTESIEK